MTQFLYIILLVLWCCPSSQQQYPKNYARAVFYSPAIVGEDPLVRKIDIYTQYFNNLHQRDIELMSIINVTHVVVSENWAADGSNAHHDFLNLIVQNNLKIIVTFAIPTTNDAVLNNKAKSSFALLLQEFSKYSDTLYGFRIPAPPMDKMSSDDQRVYFDLVNQLYSLIILKTETRPKLLVGFPMDPTDGSIPKIANFLYSSVNKDFWLLDIFSPKGAFVEKFKYFLAQSFDDTPIIPIIKISSFDNNKKISNESNQEYLLNQTLHYAEDKIGDLKLIIIMEYSDEWWRSDLSTVGYDPEGCPNSNAYAHTSCGIVTFDGILNLEYMGLFFLRDTPLHFCVIPKSSALFLQKYWNSTHPSSLKVGSLICTGLTSIVPWYVYPILAGVSFFVLTLLLFLPTPNPPKISDRQFQFYNEDDLLGNPIIPTDMISPTIQEQVAVRDETEQENTSLLTTTFVTQTKFSIQDGSSGSATGSFKRREVRLAENVPDLETIPERDSSET